MSNLYGTMAIATGALGAEQGALQATTNNVANVNTPGYSRLRPVLVENNPIVMGSVTYGTGVSLQKLLSLRDPILQLRIQEETQQQGQLNASVTALQQAQVQFTTGSGDIGTEIASVFSSLAPAFDRPHQLGIAAGSADCSHQPFGCFQQHCQQSFSATHQPGPKRGSGCAAGERAHRPDCQLEQSDQPVAGSETRCQLSSLVDVATIQSDNGLTLTTSNGTALVVGDQSFALSTQADPSGVRHVFSQGTDITATLTSGDLAGLLQVRDQTIPGLLSSLDTLAAGLANGLNTANQTGFDLNGVAGGNLFVPPPAGGVGAAAGMAVAIADPALIAASSDGTPGSNGNLAVLSAVHDQPVAGGQTPTSYYSNMVFGVGNDVANSTAELSASQLILSQLQDQRASISGVSLNEEASNMVQFQRAFDAAAQIVTTVNDMPRSCAEAGVLRRVVPLIQIPEQILQATRYHKQT